MHTISTRAKTKGVTGWLYGWENNSIFVEGGGVRCRIQPAVLREFAIHLRRFLICYLWLPHQLHANKKNLTTMKITLTIFTFLLVFLIFSCGQNNQNKNVMSEPAGSALTTDTNVIRVYVDSSGIISADGEMVTIMELDSAMKNLKGKNGTVYYSRDNITGAPPQESLKVMEIVVKYKLPVKFFTDKTFTEAVKVK